MSARVRRIEILSNDDGHTVVARSTNGTDQLTSKPYRDRRGARECIAAWFGPISSDASWHGSVRIGDDVIEVREVDERATD